MSDRTTGILKLWLPDRGFGFLTPDLSGGPDVFAGKAAFDHAGITEPERGARYSFEIVHDSQGRPRAWDIEHAGTAKAAREIFNPVRP